jgi:hypothetical protein
MKFLGDAHLQRRLAQWLQELGHEAIHMLFFRMANSSSAVSRVRISNTGNRQRRDVYTGGADGDNICILT